MKNVSESTWEEVAKEVAEKGKVACVITREGILKIGYLKVRTNTIRWPLKYAFSHPGLPGGRLVISLWQIKSTPRHYNLRIRILGKP